MKSLIIAATVLAIGASQATAKPPILYNVSHHTLNPELRSQVWSTHAAIREHVSSNPTVWMASQTRPRFFSADFASRWAVIIASRNKHGQGVITNPDGSPVLLPSGHQDMTLKPENMLARALEVFKLNPSMIIFDEVTANTSDEAAAFLYLLDERALTDPVAQEVRRRLAFFIVGGDTVRPQSFPEYLRNFIAHNKSPVYAELYGGKYNPDENRIKVNARILGLAIKRMQRIGWNVRPMVSAKRIHIGESHASVKRLKWRVDAVIRATGIRPAFWHLNSGNHPGQRGIARLAIKVSSPDYHPPRLTPREERAIKEMVKVRYRNWRK